MKTEQNNQSQFHSVLPHGHNRYSNMQ